MFEKLKLICCADTENLAHLAEIAASGDAAFFNGASFNGADLRETDLSHFQLIGATFSGARIDGKTTFPSDINITSFARDDDEVSQINEKIETLRSHINQIIIRDIKRLEYSFKKKVKINIRSFKDERKQPIPNNNHQSLESKISRLLDYQFSAANTLNSTLSIKSSNYYINYMATSLKICTEILYQTDAITYRRVWMHNLPPEMDTNTDQKLSPDNTQREQKKWQDVIIKMRSKGILDGDIKYSSILISEIAENIFNNIQDFISIPNLKELHTENR